MQNSARLTSIFLVLFSVFSADLWPADVQTTPDLQASLIIVGPGNPVYTYWGHIGIAIDNSRTGENIFYDFGNFSFYSENFYANFALGRMLYRGMATPTDYFIEYSMADNRDFTVYPLNLDSQSAAELDVALRRWMLPENREYLYEYFRNNCSTIIRDLLNQATDGALKHATGAIPDQTYRHYARTGSAPSLAAELALHFLLGPTEDKPISLWDKMFLPQAVADTAMELNYAGKDGVERRLITDVKILKRSTRPPVPSEPRRLWPLMLIVGLLVSTLGITVRRLIRKTESRAVKSLSTAYLALVVLLVGLPGLVLGFLMGFTDHAAAYGNINLWAAFPTVLFALIPLFRSISRTTAKRDDARSIISRNESIFAWIWTLNLIGVIAAVFLSLSGIRAQNAGAFWAFYGPIALSLSKLGLWIERKYFLRY